MEKKKTSEAHRRPLISHLDFGRSLRHLNINRCINLFYENVNLEEAPCAKYMTSKRKVQSYTCWTLTCHTQGLWLVACGLWHKAFCWCK